MLLIRLLGNFTKMMRIFNKSSSFIGKIYAVNDGVNKGFLFVILKEYKNSFKICFLPNFRVETLPKKDLKLGIKTRIIEYLETMPFEYIPVIESEIEYRENALTLIKQGKRDQLLPDTNKDKKDMLDKWANVE